MQLSCRLLGLFWVVSALSQAEENDTAIVVDLEKQQENEETTLKNVDCSKPLDCNELDGTYCDVDVGRCLCKPDYPVTDTNHCYKESKYNGFCQLDIQCQRRDKNTKCNRDFNVCECQPRYIAQSYKNGQYWCVKPTSSQALDTSVGSYVDPTLLGIMGVLALMFIVLCVVLQMFAKARFQENRSIFNTPNPRLMNVSLLKESGNVNTKQQPSQQSLSKKRKSRATSASQDSDVEESSVQFSVGIVSSSGRKRSQQPPRGLRRTSSIAASNADDKIEMKDSLA